MKEILLEEVVEAVKGLCDCKFDIKIKGISTDSRGDLTNKIFIPLKGDIFDGHNFIEKAFENGAICCLTEKELNINKPTIKVESTKKALRDLANYYLKKFNIPVVAITGSVGKTTTKDMIASVLSEKYNTIKTEGNFNNEIGLPLTVFNIDETTECAVLEMGMNSFGEIHNLSEISNPNICVITNIGVTHIEYLGSQENIYKAKSEIFDFMKEDGVAILNGDDKFLTNTTLKNVDYFAIENKNANYFAYNIVYEGLSGTSFTISCNNEDKFNAYVPLSGYHMVQNAVCATAVAFRLGLSKEQIINGLKNFKPSKMRMDIIKKETFTIINDVYNASPISMKAMIDVLCTMDNSVCILGDMFELGDYAKDFHLEVGEYAKYKNIKKIICVGENAKYIYEGAYGHSFVKYFENQENLFLELESILGTGDTVLVKASRGMEFEKTIAYLSELEVI